MRLVVQVQHPLRPTMSSCLSIDAEEGRKRRREINKDVLDVIEEGMFHEFIKSYKHNEYVEMDKPRPRSYNKHGYE